MKIHSDEAWEIASQYSYTLASDTRTLAAQIDELIEKKIQRIKEQDTLLAKLQRYEKALNWYVRNTGIDGLAVTSKVALDALQGEE